MTYNTGKNAIQKNIIYMYAYILRQRFYRSSLNLILALPLPNFGLSVKLSQQDKWFS